MFALDITHTQNFSNGLLKSLEVVCSQYLLTTVYRPVLVCLIGLETSSMTFPFPSTSHLMNRFPLQCHDPRSSARPFLKLGQINNKGNVILNTYWSRCSNFSRWKFWVQQNFSYLLGIIAMTCVLIYRQVNYHDKIHSSCKQIMNFHIKPQMCIKQNPH